jgi:hypothetical protein
MAGQHFMLDGQCFLAARQIFLRAGNIFQMDGKLSPTSQLLRFPSLVLPYGWMVTALPLHVSVPKAVFSFLDLVLIHWLCVILAIGYHLGYHHQLLAVGHKNLQNKKK